MLSICQLHLQLSYLLSTSAAGCSDSGTVVVCVCLC